MNKQMLDRIIDDFEQSILSLNIVSNLSKKDPLFIIAEEEYINCREKLKKFITKGENNESIN